MTNWIKDGIDHEPMSEKIAKAIFPEIKWAYKWHGDLKYEELNDHAKNTLRGIAKAVLAVMVDPTLEMRKAARFEACEIDYPAMIAAAWQREEGNNGAPVGSAPPSDDGGSMAHNSSNPPSHSHSPSPVYGGEKLANEVIKRLQFAQIASCECETKTHEAKYHEPACLYRILSEAEIVARAYLELVENQKSKEPPSIVERFLLKHAKGCLHTVKYAEDNADDWAGALPAADRERLKNEASMFQLAADYLATQGLELHRLRALVENRGGEREETIELCAKVAERYPMVNGEGYDGNDIAEHIRALLSPTDSGSMGKGEVNE